MRQKLLFVPVFLLIVLLCIGCPPADDGNGGNGAEGDTVNWVEGAEPYSATYTDGNVGIGTTAPGYILDVNGTVRSSTGGFMLPDGTLIDEAADLGTTETVYWASTTGGINYDDGFVGIKRWNPSYTLDVVGDMKLTEELTVGNNEDTDILLQLIGMNTFTDTQFRLMSHSSGGANQGGIDIDAVTDYTCIQAWRNTVSPWDPDPADLALQPDGGQVGIGTTSPIYELDVVGNINVTGDYYDNGALADYVFDEEYDFLSIEEHAQIMWENKHLPNVFGKDDLGDKPYSMSERREQILEELEIAHIYINQLNSTLNTLLDTVESQQNTIEQLQQEIGNLKDK